MLASWGREQPGQTRKEDSIYTMTGHISKTQQLAALAKLG